MKITLSVKHKPAESPGSWEDSELVFQFKGDRDAVTRIENALRDALREPPRIRYVDENDRG